MTRLVEKIKTRDIKAVFIDECNLCLRTKNWIEELMPLVDYLWIVPSTENLKNKDYQEMSTNFVFVNLEQNFRNSQQIIKATQSVAEKKGYHYKEGIAMPPSNSPSGCEATFVDTFEGAVKEARKRTNEGILVVVDYRINKHYFDVLNHSKEIWKAYHEKKNEFEEGENPYKFLQQGNILIINERASLGFEWSTVIVFEQNTRLATYHDCNFMIRCTTNLVIVK